MSCASGKLVVVSGPSGVGKSTIVKEVLARTAVAYSVSATTRQPRAGEVDGRDYFFVDRARFEQMIRDGELLEWAEVFGNLYGTPKRCVQEAVASGRTVLLEIDVQGGLQVAGTMPQAVFILLLPPSDQELRRRLAGRRSEDEDSLARRLDKARHEIDIATSSGVYRHCVVNSGLQEAIEQVVGIINQESCAR